MISNHLFIKIYSKINFITYLCLFFVYSVFCSSCKNSTSKNKKDYKKNVARLESTITDTLQNVNQEKANINIFIENSASMDGYVSTESDFKNSVYGLITDLKARDISGSINLNYINDTICTFKENAVSEDIEYFIKNLNPKTFKNNGCERKTSYLPDIIKLVAQKSQTDVNILASDCIFSTGAENTEQFLIHQKNSIELLLSDELRKYDFSTILLKFDSQFNGLYYVENRTSSDRVLKCADIRRPYYILIFGKRENLMGILENVKFSDYVGFENSYYLLTPNANKPNSKILRNGKKGNFEISGSSFDLILNKARYDKKDDAKIFQFSIATNLKYMKMDDSYLTNVSNYELPPNYYLSSVRKIKELESDGLKDFTHILTIGTKDLKQNQDVYIKLKTNLPTWVNESTTMDDGNQNKENQNKTFGIIYLIEGISEAYSNKYAGKEQFGINIKVSSADYNKHGKSSRFPMWIIFLLLPIIGFMIYFKNKK